MAEADPNQPDPWGACIESGNAPKPKPKEEGNSWGEFKPGEAEPLPEDLQERAKSGGGKKAWKKPSGPSGPNLARTRITETKIVGQVVDWKGKYGWILPKETLQHPKAFKHQGKIFISVTDLGGSCRQLYPGTICEFYVFEDEAGIGAEECTMAPQEPKGFGKGGKGGFSSNAQSGGSRPSGDRNGKGSGKKGGGAGGGFGGGKAGGKAGDSAVSGQHERMAGAWERASGQQGGKAASGAFGQTGANAGGGRGFGDAGQKGKGGRGGGHKGGNGHSGLGKAGSKGGRPNSDLVRLTPSSMPAAQQFGKGFGGGKGGGGGAAAAGGGGLWDAFNGQRTKGQPFGHQEQVSHAPPAGHNPFSAPDPFMGQQRMQAPDNSLMSQGLFHGGMPAPNAGLDPHFMMPNFMQASAAPSFAQGFPMVPPATSMAGPDGGYAAPSYGGFDMAGLPPMNLNGFGTPGLSFPSQAPPGGGFPGQPPPGSALFGGPMI